MATYWVAEDQGGDPGNNLKHEHELYITGDVGIGTTAPSDRLTVVMPSGVNQEGLTLQAVAASGSGSQPGVRFNNSSGTELANVFASSDNRLYLKNNGTYALVIDSAGNVGVGTSDPGALLDVRGSVVFNEDEGDNDFRVDGTSVNLLVCDASTNRVGIGTSTPEAKLHIVGSLRMVDGNQGAGKIMQSDANGTASWVSPGGGSGIGDGHSLDAADGSPTDVVYVDNNGKVGIGTTEPDHELEIRSAEAMGVNLALVSTAEDAPSYLIMQCLNCATANPVVLSWRPADGDAGRFKISLGGASGNNGDLVMDRSTGNVGIGTTSPHATLHLLHYQTDSSILFDASGSGSGLYQIGLDYGSGFRVAAGGFDADEEYLLLTGGDITIRGGGGSAYQAGGTIQITSKGSAYGDGCPIDIKAQNGKGTGAGGNGGHVLLRPGVAGTGSNVHGGVSVGWYGATPDRLLHVEANDATTNSVTYVQRLAHVTTGTAAAGFAAGLEFELETATSGTNEVAATIEALWTTATAATAESALILKTIDKGDDDLAERMRIDKDGNVGIGTTSPSEKLHVDGMLRLKVYSDATRGSAGTAGRVIFNSTDGNLNIDDGTNWILPDGTTT